MMIGSEHPQCLIRLEDSPSLPQPGAREGFIISERLKFVPVVIDRSDLALIGPVQVAIELEIIGWIGEDEIDRCGRNLAHLLEAVADQHGIVKRLKIRPRLEPHGTPQSKRNELTNPL